LICKKWSKIGRYKLQLENVSDVSKVYLDVGGQCHLVQTKVAEDLDGRK